MDWVGDTKQQVGDQIERPFHPTELGPLGDGSGLHGSDIGTRLDGQLGQDGETDGAEQQTRDQVQGPLHPA